MRAMAVTLKMFKVTKANIAEIRFALFMGLTLRSHDVTFPRLT